MESVRKELTPNQLRLKGEINKAINRFPVDMSFSECIEIFKELIGDYKEQPQFFKTREAKTK